MHLAQHKFSTRNYRACTRVEILPRRSLSFMAMAMIADQWKWRHIHIYAVSLFYILTCVSPSLSIGWGKTRPGSRLANTLQQAALRLNDPETCKAVWTGPVDWRAAVCAGSGQAGQSGSCKGDSGGPLVCREGNAWILRGIVSWGARGCNTKYYSVFTRVSSIVKWIDESLIPWAFMKSQVLHIVWCNISGEGCRGNLNLNIGKRRSNCARSLTESLRAQQSDRRPNPRSRVGYEGSSNWRVRDLDRIPPYV